MKRVAPTSATSETERLDGDIAPGDAHEFAVTRLAKIAHEHRLVRRARDSTLDSFRDIFKTLTCAAERLFIVPRPLGARVLGQGSRSDRPPR